jgi:hypothetical protein
MVSPHVRSLRVDDVLAMIEFALNVAIALALAAYFCWSIREDEPTKKEILLFFLAGIGILVCSAIALALLDRDSFLRRIVEMLLLERIQVGIGASTPLAYALLLTALCRYRKYKEQ